jgi:hypothetical protein
MLHPYHNPASTVTEPLDGWRAFRNTSLISMHYALASSPLWAMVCLYLLTWRAASFLGHWPRPDIDTSKAIPADSLSDLLCLLTWGSSAAAILSILFIPFSVVLFERLIPLRHQIIVFVIFVLSWMIFLFVPRVIGVWVAD